MIKKTLGLLMAALLLSIALIGCSEKEEEMTTEEPESADENRTTAVFADTQSATNLDPAVSWNSWYTSRYGITETLFKLDEELVAQPFLVEDYEMIDETTWEITLRDDVTFHNGTKLTAEAVKKSWERTMDLNARLNDMLYIETIETDGQTLTIKNSKPTPAFISSLAEPLSGIIDVDSGTDPELEPVGTGPFIPTSFVANSKATVERYEDYWGGVPKLEEVTFNIIADTNSLAMAQQTGESDLSVSMPSTSIELFSDESKYTVDGVAGSRGQVVFMNFDNPFIQDVNVRKAISMAIDKEGYANVLNKGASVPTTGLYPDFMEVSSENLEGYSYDLDQAKQLLLEAGYEDSDNDGFVEKDGEKLSLRIVTYSTKAELPAYAEDLASKLKEIGIDLQVEVYESVAEHQKTGDFDLMLISYTMAPTGDSQYFANLAFQTDGSSNYGHYSNPEVDELIEQLEVEFDQEKRYELTGEIEQLIIEDAGFIVIGHAKFINVMSSQLKNVESNPSEYYLLNVEAYIE